MEMFLTICNPSTHRLSVLQRLNGQEFVSNLFFPNLTSAQSMMFRMMSPHHQPTTLMPLLVLRRHYGEEMEVTKELPLNKEVKVTMEPRRGGQGDDRGGEEEEK